MIALITFNSSLVPLIIYLTKIYIWCTTFYIKRHDFIERHSYLHDINHQIKVMQPKYVNLDHHTILYNIQILFNS